MAMLLFVKARFLVAVHRIEFFDRAKGTGVSVPFHFSSSQEEMSRHSIRLDLFRLPYILSFGENQMSEPFTRK